jgi:hypothetical protein
MSSFGLLLISARVNAVSSGAVLTLVLPLGLALVAFVVWFVAFRRYNDRRTPGE